jgi:hypothetical protein
MSDDPISDSLDLAADIVSASLAPKRRVVYKMLRGGYGKGVVSGSLLISTTVCVALGCVAALSQTPVRHNEQDEHIQSQANGNVSPGDNHFNYVLSTGESIRQVDSSIKKK